MRDDPMAGIRLAFGLSGCGKTHGVREGGVFPYARSGRPAVVLDIPREWKRVPNDLAPVAYGARSGVREAIDALNRGKKLVICWADDPIRDGSALVSWALHHGPAAVAIPEAHEAISKHALDPVFKKALTQWRHHGIALFLDTQRPALLNTTAVAQACETRIYAIGEASDLQWVYSLGGHELVALVREAAVRFRESKLRGHNPDGRGWHVRLDESRMGPYELTRL